MKRRNRAKEMKAAAKRSRINNPGRSSNYARKFKWLLRHGKWGFEVSSPKPWKTAGIVLWEALLLLMFAVLVSLLVFTDAQAGGLVNSSQLAAKALARPGHPANPGQPAPPRISIASTSLDSIAKPLSAISISLDIAVARGLAKPKKPAQVKSQLARGGSAARPGKLLHGMK